MQATIHLLPFARGGASQSFAVTVADAAPADAADALFEASNCGTATESARSMSVGDVAEIPSADGPTFLGCAPCGWVSVPAGLMPLLGRLDVELRRKVFEMRRRVDAS